jgi:molybdenum cofactor cytidylyltransferase
MISGIILAAGSSTRMGTQKLTAKLGGKRVLSYVIDSFLGSRLDEVVVVASEGVTRVVPQSLRKRVRIVINSQPKEGMSHSLKLGLGSVRGEAAVIGMGDQPLLLSSTIDAIVKASESRGVGIVIPTYGGQRGNPVLFDRELFPQVMSIGGDVGAKSVVAANPGLVREVDVRDEGVLLDIDTPSDLARAEAVLGRRSRRRKNRAAGALPQERQHPARSSPRGPPGRRWSA